MRTQDASDVIKTLNNESKTMRGQVFSIVIYSDGIFDLKELYELPLYQHEEIMETFKEKAKAREDQLAAAQGKKTF